VPGGRQEIFRQAQDDRRTAEQEGAVGGEWVLLPQAVAGEFGGGAK